MKYIGANRQRLFEDVKFLASIDPFRNYRNIESLKKAADYIKIGYERIGMQVSRQKWEVDGNVYENIIASYQPQNRKRLIIGAHYDVYNDQPGANDNASAVAGLLEVARLLSANTITTEYGIDFVSYCLEEPPFFKTKNLGSYIHAKSIYDQNPEVVGMISFEMIGYYGEKSNVGARGDHRAGKNYLIVSGIRKYYDFNKKIAQLLKINKTMSIRTIMYSDDYRNNAPSDHLNYLKFGFPAAMIIGSSGTGNPHYHKITDTIETLNFDIMKVAVDSIAHAVYNF